MHSTLQGEIERWNVGRIFVWERKATPVYMQSFLRYCHFFNGTLSLEITERLPFQQMEPEYYHITTTFRWISTFSFPMMHVLVGCFQQERKSQYRRTVNTVFIYQTYFPLVKHCTELWFQHLLTFAKYNSF